MYSDGKVLVMEDFFRPSKLLGYDLETKREKERRKEYRKMEIFLPLDKIDSIELVTKGKAEEALRKGNTCHKLQPSVIQIIKLINKEKN